MLGQGNTVVERTYNSSGTQNLVWIFLIVEPLSVPFVLDINRMSSYPKSDTR